MGGECGTAGGACRGAHAASSGPSGEGWPLRWRKVGRQVVCRHEFSASTINELNTRLDAELKRFVRQMLETEYPYLIIDARYEKVREDGVIRLNLRSY